MRDLLWSSSTSKNKQINKKKKEKPKMKEAKRKLGKERKRRMALCLVCWKPEREVKGSNTCSQWQDKIPLLMLSYITCSCREQFHVYKVYSHSAIAFLSFSTTSKGDEDIQRALFLRLNYFFLHFPKEWMSSFFTLQTPYLKVYFAEVGNIVSPQGQKQALILR